MRRERPTEAVRALDAAPKAGRPPAAPTAPLVQHRLPDGYPGARINYTPVR
ncbi:hypothetical protein ACH4U7_39980 [Streptomyces sp. NPDC020845]|uniref:hypothetical protein n=1 Tax=Streptomyces sp. NPDC020845 TaxID=3365096 RepID=UPI0037B80256